MEAACPQVHFDAAEVPMIERSAPAQGAIPTQQIIPNVVLPIIPLILNVIPPGCSAPELSSSTSSPIPQYVPFVIPHKIQHPSCHPAHHPPSPNSSPSASPPTLCIRTVILLIMPAAIQNLVGDDVGDDPWADWPRWSMLWESAQLIQIIENCFYRYSVN